jgi:hypothetical protein
MRTLIYTLCERVSTDCSKMYVSVTPHCTDSKLDCYKQITLCYYDVKDALAIDEDHTEAKRLMKVLEEHSVELKDKAMKLNLLGQYRDALQKISLAIETNPSQAEYHILR